MNHNEINPISVCEIYSIHYVTPSGMNMKYTHGQEIKKLGRITAITINHHDYMQHGTKQYIIHIDGSPWKAFESKDVEIVFKKDE